MSVNQSIKPITAEVRAGHLFIGGCDTVDLVKQYGTPLYVIDEQTLRTVCREYKQAFKVYPDVSVMYASKALATSSVFKIVSDEGLGLDVVSGGEVYTARNAGVDMSRVLFNGNNKQRWELELAIDSGVGRVSVDNFYEIELLSEVAKEKGKNVEVLLRVTPGIDCHTHQYIQTGQLDSKFGFDLSQIDEVIRLINSKGNLLLKGLHAHIGSQIFEIQAYRDEVRILVSELARINKAFSLNLNELNLGGGVGVKYVETDEPPNISDVANVIIDELKKVVTEKGLENVKIFVEPGRSIISTSGVTLYTVGSSKQVPNSTKYVAVDGGMADNPRHALYQAEYTCEVANKMDVADRESVTVAGRYCESGDILVRNVSLPSMQAGDILCVYNTGAYNYSMENNYNRTTKNAMVLVNNSQSDIIVNRETLEDLISRDSIPDRLKEC